MGSMQANPSLFIGLMSGTSLDGVDGVLAAFPKGADDARPIQTLGTAYLSFPAPMRAQLMALQADGPNEIHREALAANLVARCYADCITTLLRQTGIRSEAVIAVGAHGQTIRHRPESGYTWQSLNSALLAELTEIDVIADFRSRDIAAGGQGAPLVPAFHQAIFGDKNETRVVANIGGISNISVLGQEQNIIGFDTGPGNVLMDAWIARHHGKEYDADGLWAASGKVVPALLEVLCKEPFLALPPPKSTGRDLFHSEWLNEKLAGFPEIAAADVQATLAEFTATTLADSIAAYAPTAQAVYVCGGGAFNRHLMHRLEQTMRMRAHTASVQSTEALGVSPNHVEALAFAWLAHRFHRRLAGNLPSVTGAKGLRILGALYPAN